MLILCVKWQTECTGGNSEVGHGRISFPTLCHQIFGSRIILFFFLPFQGQYEVPWLETMQVSNWQTVLLHNCMPPRVGSSLFLEEYRDDEL